MRHKWNVPGILIILININNCIREIKWGVQRTFKNTKH